MQTDFQIFLFSLSVNIHSTPGKGNILAKIFLANLNEDFLRLQASAGFLSKNL